MARVDRIVKRQGQREELSNLKALIKASKPLIEADKTLRQAYMAGYAARLQEEQAEQKTQQEVAAAEVQAETPSIEQVVDNINAHTEAENAVHTAE